MNQPKITILQTIGRLRCVTIQQLKMACWTIPHTTFFRSLKYLRHNHYILRVSHPWNRLYAYQATQKGYELLYGNQDIRIRGHKIDDLKHSLSVAEAFVSLLHYKNITGFSLEHEFDPDKLNTFCFQRRPDAIVQLTNNNLSYAIALEVECSLKESKRIDGILNNYEKTFQKGLACQGVLIIATSDEIFESYYEKISKKPKSFEERVLLIKSEDILKLNQSVYGALQDKMELWWNSNGTEVPCKM